MVAKVKEEVKRREKEIMQRLMLEERGLFLEENEADKGNGFYERLSLTANGLIEDLRVPRTRSKGFYPSILLEEKESKKLPFLILSSSCFPVVLTQGRYRG